MKAKLSFVAALACGAVWGAGGHNIWENIEWFPGNGLILKNNLQNPYPVDFFKHIKLSKLGFTNGKADSSWADNPFKGNHNWAQNNALCNGYFTWAVGGAIADGKIELSIADLLYAPGYAYTMAYDGYNTDVSSITQIGNQDGCEDEKGNVYPRPGGGCGANARKVRYGEDTHFSRLNYGNNCVNPLYMQQARDRINLVDRRTIDDYAIMPKYNDALWDSDYNDLHLYYDKKIVEKYGSLVYRSYGLKANGGYEACFSNMNGHKILGCDNDKYGYHLGKFDTLDYGYKNPNENKPTRLVALSVRGVDKGSYTLGALSTLNGSVNKSNNTELTEDIYKLTKPAQYGTGVIDTYVTGSKALTYFITQDHALPRDKGNYLESLVKTARSNPSYFRTKNGGKDPFFGGINVSKYSSATGALQQDLLSYINVDFDTLGVLAPQYFESVFFKLPNGSKSVTSGYDGAYKTDVYVQHSDWLNRYVTGFGNIAIERSMSDGASRATGIYDGGWYSHRYLKNPSKTSYASTQVIGANYWESDIKAFGLAYDMYDPVTTYIKGDPAYKDFASKANFVYKQYAIDDPNDSYVNLHIRPLFAQVKSDGQGGYIAEHQNSINQAFGNGAFDYQIKYVFYPDPTGAKGYRIPTSYNPTLGEMGNAALLDDGYAGTGNINKNMFDAIRSYQNGVCNKNKSGFDYVTCTNAVVYWNQASHKNTNKTVEFKHSGYSNRSQHCDIAFANPRASYSDFAIVCQGEYVDTVAPLRQLKDTMTQTTFNEIKGLDKSGNPIKNAKGAPIFVLQTGDQNTKARRTNSVCDSFDSLETCLNTGDIVEFDTTIDIFMATHGGTYIKSGVVEHYAGVTQGGTIHNAFDASKDGITRKTVDFAHRKASDNLSASEKDNARIMQGLLGREKIKISFDRSEGKYIGYLNLGSKLNGFVVDGTPLVLEGHLGNILDEKTGRIVKLPGNIKIIIDGENTPVTPDVNIISVYEGRYSTSKNPFEELDFLATQVHHHVVGKDKKDQAWFRYKQSYETGVDNTNSKLVKITLQKKSGENWLELGNVYIANKCLDESEGNLCPIPDELKTMAASIGYDLSKLNGYNKIDEKNTDFSLFGFDGAHTSAIKYNSGHSTADLGVGVYRFAIRFDYVGSTDQGETKYTDAFTIRPEAVSLELYNHSRSLGRTLQANKNYATSAIKHPDIIQQGGAMDFVGKFVFEKGVSSTDLANLDNKLINEMFYVIPLIEIGGGNGFSGGKLGGAQMNLANAKNLNKISNMPLAIDGSALKTNELYVKVPYRTKNTPFVYKLNLLTNAEWGRACDDSRGYDLDDNANKRINGIYGCSPLIVKNAQENLTAEQPYAIFGAGETQEKQMAYTNSFDVEADHDVLCKPINSYGFFRTKFDDDFEKSFSFVTKNNYNVVYGCIHKYFALDERTNLNVPIYGMHNDEIVQTKVQFESSGGSTDGLRYTIIETNRGTSRLTSNFNNAVFVDGHTVRNADGSPKYVRSGADEFGAKVIKSANLNIDSFPSPDMDTGYGKGGKSALNSKIYRAISELLGNCAPAGINCTYAAQTISPTKDYNEEVEVLADKDYDLSGIGNTFRVAISKDRVKSEPVYITDKTTTQSGATTTRGVLKYATTEPQDAYLNAPLTNTSTTVSVSDHVKVNIYENGSFKSIADDSEYPSVSRLDDLRASIASNATLASTPILALGVNNTDSAVGYDIRSLDASKTTQPFIEASVFYFGKDKDLFNILQPLNPNLKIIYDPQDGKGDWRGVGHH